MVPGQLRRDLALVDTFGVDGSEFLIGFGPLQNPTPQIGYPTYRADLPLRK